MIAISYDNNEIHILNINNYHIIYKLYIDYNVNNIIKAIIWISENRLISAGLNSVLIEWNLVTGLPLYSIDSYGGAVYKIVLNNNKTKLAAACDDGSIRIFNIEEKEIIYETMLARQSSRCLSLAWNENILAAGDDSGNIRIWNVKNNIFTFNMRITVNGGVEPALIWDMKIYNNNICIVDSFGRTQFYDAIFGTLISSFSLHESANMCIVVDSKGTVYSSGVENKIVQFKYINNKWTPTASCRAHSHEINSMAILNDVPDITSDQIVVLIL